MKRIVLFVLIGMDTYPGLVFTFLDTANTKIVKVMNALKHPQGVLLTLFYSERNKQCTTIMRFNSLIMYLIIQKSYTAVVWHGLPKT